MSELNTQKEASNVVNTNAALDYLKQMETEVSEFETSEKTRLDITDSKTDQWFDPVPSTFTAAQREHTTILHAG